MIREATQEDLTRLLELAKAFHIKARGKRFILFEDNIEGWTGWFEGCIQSDTHLSIVAVDDDGTLCGFLTGFIGPVMFAPGKTRMAYEGSLWVELDYQRKGHARDLIAVFCGWAKEKGCSHVTMASHRYFGWAKPDKLYRSMGFELEEKHYLKDLST